MLSYCLRVLLIASIAFNGLAEEHSPSIFYPLPIQSEGKFLAAKNLHLSSNGGIWVQDVHSNVLFYDGRHLLPRNGSLLDSVGDQLAYLNDSFWSFADNEVYRSYPSQKKELIFSLEPGSEIRKIGSSNNYIWVSDDSNFYTYDVTTSEIETYSLLELYKHNQSSYVYINDAQRVLSKWVLATTSGSYLSDGAQFTHIANSKKNFTEKIYFSSSRRELLIGTLRGALIIDLNAPSKIGPFIGDSHVLSFAETNQEYWIGTEHGLFVYSLLTGVVRKVTSSSQDSFSLLGDKIYALLNDELGGMWIATDRGIRYYSLHSKKFTRVSERKLLSLFSDSSMVKIAKDPRLGNLVATTTGIYQHRKGGEPELLYRGRVNDFVVGNGDLWLATGEGLLRFDIQSRRVTRQLLSDEFQSLSIDRVALDDERLWFSSRGRLAQLNIKNGAYKSFGKDWIVESFLPAKITHLLPTKTGDLIIGTDHGVYTYSGQKIYFNRESEVFGQVIDITQAKGGKYWVVSSYGTFTFDRHYQNLTPVTLIEDSISPECLMSTSRGMWMSSSKGLSFYSHSADLLKHYGSPSGLITNEFLPRICATDKSEPGQDISLVLGSKYGLVKIKERELLVSKAPKNTVIFSQVNIDHSPIAVGGNIKDGYQFPYGSSLSFLIGILPEASTLLLEFRLNLEDDWIAFEGGQLTLSHLLPGEYQLQIRPSITIIPDTQSLTTLNFTIQKPWYLTSFAIFSFFLIMGILVAIVIFWRSRLIMKINRNLKAKVLLKTDQLRNQSRVLLSNNQQLRKQFQVRNILVGNVAVAAKRSVTEMGARLHLEDDKSATQKYSDVIHLLNVLFNDKDNVSGERESHNFLQILNAVIDAWREEFIKAGLSVKVENSAMNQHIQIDYFNLDILFNTLFSSVLKRCYRGQELSIQISESDSMLVIALTDFGAPVPVFKPTIHKDNIVNLSTFDLSIENLPTSVAISGGELFVYDFDSKNRLEMSWPIIELEIQGPPEKAINLENSAVPSHTLTREEAWINSVKHLISENYSSPDFGTSSAAKMLFVSERSLQRRFKAALDRTFKDYLNEYRLEKACESLLAGEKIADIAFECGFNDPSYFSLRFKHHFGLSPSKFVENHTGQ